MLAYVLQGRLMGHIFYY